MLLISKNLSYSHFAVQVLSQQKLNYINSMYSFFAIFISLHSFFFPIYFNNLKVSIFGATEFMKIIWPRLSLIIYFWVTEVYI